MTRTLLALGTALSLLAPLTAAETNSLELASPFVDDAILQRGMTVPVWGWAAPASKITVAFAGQSQTATADDQGKWLVKLEPLTASTEERELTVTDGKGGGLTRKGLLVGEVWFASGQSNMDWLAGKSLCATLANTLAKSKEEIPIREYTVDSGSALFPCTRASSKDGWNGLGIPHLQARCLRRAAQQGLPPRQGDFTLIGLIHNHTPSSVPGRWGVFAKWLEFAVPGHGDIPSPKFHLTSLTSRGP